MMNESTLSEQNADDALKHVPEVIERAKRMRDLAEEMRLSARETTLRSTELRKDAAAQFKNAADGTQLQDPDTNKNER